ncbi:TonB-dependent receptor [soil metagenome]
MSMSNLRWLFATALLLTGLPAAAYAQGGTITGQVVNQDTQAPLSGVQVFVTGTNRGTLTNQEGRFLIPNVPAGQQVVRASLIGFAQGEQRVNVTAGETATVSFSLRTSAVELGGVVVSAVTGQAQRKRELGTNTASINATDLEMAPITKMADVLTGRAAGVTLQGVAGTTGTAQRIRIRGANSISLSNEPLIYVDGVQVSNSTSTGSVGGSGGIGVGGQDVSRLNDLNPEDIQNIEVLKGPAASALYGTAAANGVLLITTKKGRAGTPRWRAYVEGGQLKDVNEYPDVFLSYQVNDPTRPAFTDFGRLNTGGTSPAYRACPNVDAARGLCRQDEVISLDAVRTAPYNPFQTGNRQKYGLSVSGGGDAVTYYLSGDMEDEQGVFSTNRLDKMSLRANMNAKVLSNLDVQVTSGYIKSDLALNSNDNSIFSSIINAMLATPIVPTEEMLAAPTNTVGNRPGTGFGYFPEDLEKIVVFQDVDRYILGSTASYRPLSWLSANANVGLDFFTRWDQRTVQPGELPIAATWTPGQRWAIRSNLYNWTANSSAVATTEPMEDIVSTSTLGVSYNRSLDRNTECFGVGIVVGTNSCSAASSLFSVGEGFAETITVGGFFQQQFGWRDRVFLAGSIRGDNNSAFGQDFGFIYYPGASLSWVVTEEPFFPQTSVLSNLRLRTSYGTSGQRPNFRDAVTLLEPVSVARSGSDVSAVQLSRTGNPDLKPERTTEYEVGFDAGFLQDRLSFDFTYFNKESRDALVARRLAPSFGLTTSQWQNLGSIRNWGTELGVNARVFELPRAALNMRLSASTLDNQIEELGAGVEPIIFNRGNQRHQEGFPTGGFFGQPYTYTDADGNGLLSPSEVRMDTTQFTVIRRTRLDGTEFMDTIPEVFLGRALPTNTQSLSADLTLFRYITLSTLFERRAGMYTLNDTERFRCATGFNRVNRGNCPAVSDPNASLDDQARFIAARFLGTTSGYVEKADFIKWREFSVTLGAPEQLSRNLRALQGASLTLSGRNLATWTDYTGVDPEINETGGSSNFTQGEFNTQPPVRYMTIRLNFTF